MLREAYLDFTAMRIVVQHHHLTAHDLHALQAALYGHANNPESGIALSS
jgi:hypothetical protein